MRKNNLSRIKTLVTLLLIIPPVLMLMPFTWTEVQIYPYYYPEYVYSTSIMTSQTTYISLVHSTNVVTVEPITLSVTTGTLMCASKGVVTDSRGNAYECLSAGPIVGQTMRIQAPNRTWFTTTTRYIMGAIYVTSWTTTTKTFFGYVGDVTGTTTWTVTSQTPTATNTATGYRTFTANITKPKPLALATPYLSIVTAIPLIVISVLVVLTLLERKQIFCPRCDVHLRRGSRFCDQCGFKLE